VKLDDRLAPRVAILGKIERAAVFERHALLGGAADAFHYLAPCKIALSATGQQLAQDVLGPLDYEADVSGVRNDVQIRIRQLGGDVFGTRGKHHITELPVPDVYLHADVRQ
jgi:hypothetical protein